MTKFKLSAFLLTATICNASAENNSSLQEAFSQGKIKAKMGTYGEYVNPENTDNGHGWITTYLQLEYKTQAWNNVEFGATFMAHGEVWEDSDKNGIDRFENDIEQTSILAEAYLKLHLMENSSFTAGRFKHKEVSHIENDFSEGILFQFNELNKVTINTGLVTRFAEADYDDLEDFGREDGSQDLGNETFYGEDSKEFLYFIDATIQISENASINPYFMIQDEYAHVFGLDTDIFITLSNDIIIGSEFIYYTTEYKKDNSDEDASVYAFVPYIKSDIFHASFGYLKLDSGSEDAILPNWLNDYILPLDQTPCFGESNQDIYFGLVGIGLEKFWTHIAYANYSHDAEEYGTDSDEYEFQIGYNFAENIGVGVGLYHVNFDGVENEDYEKVEFHGHFTF